MSDKSGEGRTLPMLCANCVSFEPGDGTCRYKPPVITSRPFLMVEREGGKMTAAESGFPSTRPEWWCREFISAPAGAHTVVETEGPTVVSVSDLKEGGDKSGGE